MKKINDARLLIYSSGLLISSVIERVVTFIITSYVVLNPWIYHTISIVLLVVVFLVVNVVLKKIMRSDRVHRKLLGNEYVAGRWIETTHKVDDEGKETEHIGYCCLDISYEEDGLNIVATNYSLDLEVNYMFYSKSASLENYVLDYAYIRYRKDGKRDPDWGNILFRKNSISPPTFYTGAFKRDDDTFRFKGFLINDKSDLKLLDKNFSGNFHKVFCKYTESVKREE